MKKLLFTLTAVICVILLCMSVFASKTTVYVSVNGDDTASGTAEAPLKTLYSAFRALPYGGTIVVCDELSLSLTEFPKSNGIITVTSHDGTTDYRTSGAKLTLKDNMHLKSAVNFENINFKVTETGINFICNGNYTCFGEGIKVTTANLGVEHPNITVGASGLVGSDGGFVEVHSGTFSRLYGGLTGTNSAKATGDFTVAIYGGTFKQALYFAGVTEATGTHNAYIYGGKFENGLVGAAVSDISGELNITVYGGEFTSDAYLRPATSGTLSGKCTINVLGGNIKSIFNTSGGSLTGNLVINLASGIKLTSNPYTAYTSTVSDAQAEQIEEANGIALESAKAQKTPAATENPLTSRESKYTGIADKATSFTKKTAGGDFDNDGVITLLDVLRAFTSACGTYSETADINEDKAVSVQDCILILKSALSNQEPIAEYTVNNVISRLVRYGGAAVTDNTFEKGYIFGSTEEASYSVYSNVELKENAIAGIFFGCNVANPNLQSGYYFEVNTSEESLKVYRIENSTYRTVADKKLHLLSNEAEIKVTYGKTADNSVQFYFNDNPLVTDYYFDFDLTLASKGKGVGIYVENATATTPVVVKEAPEMYAQTYLNPIINNLTDPDIFYEDGVYYIYGTKSGGTSDGVQCFTTSDFVTFEDQGIILSQTDAYGDGNIVAANIIKSGGIYCMFYLQESTSLGVNTTAFATASSPTGPFVTETKVPLTNATDLIGGQPFLDDDGSVYLVYTRTTGGNKTCVAKVNLADGKAELDLSTETLLILPTQEWEYAKASVAECGFIIKHDGTYYLIYAGGNYNSTYGVGYATADNIYGPYTKYEYNPIMWSNDQAFGNGAASVFVSPDASEHFIIYLRNTGHSVTRPLNTCIDRIRFVENPYGGPDILEIEGASVSPRSLPSGIGSNFAFDYQMARWHW